MSAGLSSRSPVGTARSDNEAKYRSRNPVVRRLVARFLQRVGDLVEAERPRRILEVGCGEAMVIEYLGARVPAARFHGVELDAEALARGRARCPGVSFLRADAYDLPFESGSHDLVLCLEVLEHLREPDRALREIRRVSRGGCLLSVPHEPFFRLGNLLRGKHVGRLGNPSDHVQHWGARGFTAFCARELAVRTATHSFPWLLVYGTV
ncbi:MAG TPA: class I SAM-dependent methyltransferase [Methylomirabilota bacterium]|nr:class I SAM-dependent methyltransferase [Methylomirabilota bacterium]